MKSYTIIVALLLPLVLDVQAVVPVFYGKLLAAKQRELAKSNNGVVDTTITSSSDVTADDHQVVDETKQLILAEELLANMSAVNKCSLCTDLVTYFKEITVEQLNRTGDAMVKACEKTMDDHPKFKAVCDLISREFGQVLEWTIKNCDPEVFCEKIHMCDA